MNEAIVRAEEWRQQGEEGRLGRPVDWLDHMFSWPACYSALSSQKNQSWGLLPHDFPECHGAAFTDRRSSDPFVYQLFSDLKSSFLFFFKKSFIYSSCGSWIKSKFCTFFHRWRHHFCSDSSLLQQLYTRGRHCAVISSPDLLLWMSHYHVKRVKPRDCPSVFTTCVTRGALTRAQTQHPSTQIHSDRIHKSLTSWTRMGALAKWRQPAATALYCTRGTFPPFALGLCVKPTCWGMGQSCWLSWSGHLGP